MAVVKTWMRVEPSFENKHLAVRGIVAVNEKVDVTVSGVAYLEYEEEPLPQGLVLRLVSACGRMEYARFPADSEQKWAQDEENDENAICVLDLNTLSLRRAFAHKCIDDTIEAVVLLEDRETDNLYGTGRITLRNWVQNPCDPVAGSSQILDAINVLINRADNHTHNGTDSAQFAHNNLTDRNANGCHPNMESDIIGAQNVAGVALSTADTADSNAAAALSAANTAKETADTTKDYVEEELPKLATKVYVNTEIENSEAKVVDAIALTAKIMDNDAITKVFPVSTLWEVKNALNEVINLLNAWRKVGA